MEYKKTSVDTKNMPYANKKVYELIQKETNGNVRAFAQSINVSQQSLNRIFCIDKRNGKYPSVSNEIKKGIIDVYGKDEIWFISDVNSGEGEMLNDTTPPPKQNKDLLSEYETYLLPMTTHAGSLNGVAEEGTILENCEKVISPIKNVDFAISIYGESMAPEYPSGSKVLIKKIDPNAFIDWGKAYVLDTCNGVILKEVIKSKQYGYITCHSINPDPKYSDFDISLADIYGMYRVLMCLSAK